MRKLPLLFAALSMSAACRPAEVAVSDVPEAVRYVAVLTAGPDGAASTSLELWEPGKALPIVTDRRGEAWVLAWSEEQLSEYELNLEDEIVPASGCEATLPPPIFAAYRDTGGTLRTASSDQVPPAVTAPFAQGDCPEFTGTPVQLETSCLIEACEPEVISQSGCRVRLSLEACAGGTIDVTLWPTGYACMDSTDSLFQSCSALAPENPLAASTYECESPEACTLNLYSTTGVPPFEADRVRFYPDAVPSVERTSLGRQEFDSLFVGYGSDLALLPDRLVVAATPEAGGLCPVVGVSERDSELLFLDPESLETIDTSTGPPCLHFMASNGVDRIFAAHLDETGTYNAITEFDGVGNSLETHVLDFDDLLFVDYQPTQVLYLEDPPQLVFALHNRWGGTGTNRDGGMVLLIDAVDFTEVARITFPDYSRRPLKIKAIDARRFALSYQLFPSVSILHRADLSTLEEITMAVPGLENTHLDLELAPEGAPLYVAGNVDVRVVDIDAAEETHRAMAYGRKMEVLGLEFLPRDPNLLVALGATSVLSSARTAVAASYDRRARTFLPEVADLGPGAAAMAIADDDAIYVLIPTEATIVRLR